MATTKGEKDKQVMDVSKPGKSAPDASAKPIIVGHKPMVQDPMVNVEVANGEDESTDEEAKAEGPISPISKKVIAPIVQEEESKESESSDAPTPVTETPSGEPKVEDNNEVADSTDTAVVEAVIDQVESKQPEGPNEEERKKQEELDKLVAEKKYFVPIGKAHRSSNRLRLVLIMLFFVAFIGLVLAIDAEIIDVGITLPFNLL